MRVLAKAHQFITFTTPPNLQAAVAYGLGKDDAYFDRHARRPSQRSRDRFARGPARPRLPGAAERRAPISSTSTSRPSARATTSPSASAWCSEHGVAAIPVSAFYAGGPVRTVVRFCFAKRDATLDAALERLGRGL